MTAEKVQNTCPPREISVKKDSTQWPMQVGCALRVGGNREKMRNDDARPESIIDLRLNLQRVRAETNIKITRIVQ